ncbi:9298_t:CDS:2 [Paraglomus brasilianum]|uniref:9298_t:CDS:1 n=1 Tax=Paraglomus brasilianum TaxID=144538 RepID=A0A9N9GFR8_9GLOM|nr:9298_t:CDS:2 [Paraglomus brasilianum]
MASWEYPVHKEFPLDGPKPSEVDPRDMEAQTEARERQLRKQWIKAMEARLIGNALSKCYKTEGVNHFQNCKHLVDLYLQAVKEAKFKGWRD